MKQFYDDERPYGRCYDCLMAYSEFPDMLIPDKYWEMINPTYHQGAGLLCPTCTAKRLRQLNIKDEIKCTIYIG